MKEATLNTEFGEIGIHVDTRYYSGKVDVHLTAGEDDIEIESPSVSDDVIEAAGLSRNRSGLEEEDLDDAIRLLQFGRQLVGLINHFQADALAAQADREAQEAQEQEEAAAAQAERNREREEIMLMEMVDERIKVRHRGYKTMCYGTVYAQPLYGESHRRWPEEDGEEPTAYRAKVRYSDQGDTRDRGIESYTRVDLKTERGWRTVWDDGKDDLPEWDRAVKLPKVRSWHE